MRPLSAAYQVEVEVPKRSLAHTKKSILSKPKKPAKKNKIEIYFSIKPEVI
jgi:hypothetical protein